MLIDLVGVVGVDIVDTATLFVGVVSHPALYTALYYLVAWRSLNLQGLKGRLTQLEVRISTLRDSLASFLPWVLTESWIFNINVMLLLFGQRCCR